MPELLDFIKVGILLELGGVEEGDLLIHLYLFLSVLEF